MATLDQLAPDQRAILELILRRRQSYDELGATLGMAPARVGTRARDALVELAPRTARAVERPLRMRVADYVLGQQDGAEAAATRRGLADSEPARMWAVSLLDSLDDLFADGARPEIPTAGVADGRSTGGGEASRPVSALSTRLSDARERVAAARSARSAAQPGGLSPEASALVRRRRTVAAATLVALAALLVWLLISALGGDDDAKKNKKPAAAAAAARSGSGQDQELAVMALRAVGDERGQGGAGIFSVKGRLELRVRATGLVPSQRGAQASAYEVWLYNGRTNAKSLGAAQTDSKGTFTGRSFLPRDFARYRYLDISREPVDSNAAHSGVSVLRASFKSARRPVPTGAGGTGGAGAGGGSGAGSP